MNREDQKAIDDLFVKLDNVEATAGPRDRDAEAYIAERIVAQPSAPYYMAQTIVVQEQALIAAEARLADLEAQARASANGGFFGSLFGDRSRPVPATGSVPRAGSANREPVQGQQPDGGGFLAGAAQTALGVTGGVLLGNAIAGMLGGSEAKAAEPAAETQKEESQDEPQTEEADFEDGGSDFGDFDMDL
jgi:hypothetical protein